MRRVECANLPGDEVLKTVYFSNPPEVWVIVGLDTDRTIWKFVRDGDHVYSRTPGTPFPKLNSQNWTYLTGQKLEKAFVTFINGKHEIS